ncbi:MAG: T9SS type A sorting domain-containing protein [Bacteroidia bacterium]|nr:T9SS type A sorting domain-containing protein [Bacteroidia bacterium]
MRTGVIPKIKVKWNDVLICYNLGDSIKSYQWFNGSTPLTGATNQYYQSNKIPGNYKVEIIDLYGCKNISTGIPISGTSNIFTYPNPSSGNFRLTITEIPDGQATITIIKQAGFKIKEFKTDVTDSMLSKEINLNNINEGVYLLQVLIDNDSYYSRIVIAK